MDIYYVYAYLRKSDNSPYYIGKGKNYRAYIKHQGVSLPKDKSKIVIIESGLSNLWAIARERYYIRWFGRKDNGTGILLNRTDGGEGAEGSVRSKETIEKHRQTLKDINFGGWKKSPESIAKQIETARKNGSYNRSKSSVQKQLETWKQNNSNPMKDPEIVKKQQERRRKTMVERGLWKA
jgi:hypothetical protein